MKNPLLQKALYGACALGILTAAAHGQTTVWSDDFTRVDGDGLATTTARNIDYLGDTTLDWILTGDTNGNAYTIENSATNPNLRLSDISTTGMIAAVPVAQMGTIGAADTITIQFDAKVEAYTGADNSVFRFYLTNNSTATQPFVMGYSYLDRDGAGGTENQWYALTGTSFGASATKLTTTNSLGIGYNGTSWESGFALGDYNAADAAANTSGDWYRFTITFTNGSDAFTIDAENLTTSATASVSGTMGSVITWANADPNDLIRIGTGGSGVGQFLVDNLSVTATAAAEEGSVSISMAGGTVSVEYTGTLQQSSDLATWSTLDPQPASPFTFSPTAGDKRFFKTVP
ncbi:MAG: hypothetical protein ACP5I4_13980 [Oceanipulchritudo sp.]